MFNRAAQNLQPCFRRLHHQATVSVRSHPRTRVTAVAVLASGITVGSILWHSRTHKVHSDSEVPAAIDSTRLSRIRTKDSVTREETELWNDPDTLRTLVWGSNNSQVLGTATEAGKEQPGTIRCPTIARWLDNIALRDLELHERHAACVDAKGDVYQWGDGFFGLRSEGKGATLYPTLKGKNIIKIQLTEHKVYALSASGKVYILPVDMSNQKILWQLPSNNSWWGTGWIWRDSQNARYSELAPKGSLSWTEKFVSISAGDNHLLALTNKGRTFAHPVNKQANYFGQLGFRSFEIPDPAVATGTLKVELLPRSTQADGTKDLAKIDDSTIHWCTQLYEVPVLRGVDVSQIAAGGRSSFVRTPTGRVLGWGANEYGQIGLGANVTLDTITVPTEVILWRMVPANTQSRCLNITARGDLASFTVERSRENVPTTVDLLMCGNGQSGGLGNNTYTNSQGSPVRVKNVSGLLQYSDRTKGLEPIMPTKVVISPTGHVLVALDSSAESQGVGGQDLMVWGRNYDYELGNGKKSSLAIPATLSAPDGERLMLTRRKARKVLDLRGQEWKRNILVEQCVVAGYGSSAVYWRVVR